MSTEEDEQESSKTTDDDVRREEPIDSDAAPPLASSASRPVSPVSIADRTLEALWGRAVENWDDDTAHGKFLAYAQLTKQLGAAAALYKTTISSDSPYRISPSQIIDAQKRLAGVSMLAIIDLDNNKTDPGDLRARQIVRTVGLLVVVGLFAGLVWLLMRY